MWLSEIRGEIMDKTIFRVYPDGEVIALFPQISVNIGGRHCQSYLHVGQHGGADPFIVVSQTRLATPDEYKELFLELEKIGYNPIPATRFSPKDFEIRKLQYR